MPPHHEFIFIHLWSEIYPQSLNLICEQSAGFLSYLKESTLLFITAGATADLGASQSRPRSSRRGVMRNRSCHLVHFFLEKSQFTVAIRFHTAVGWRMLARKFCASKTHRGRRINRTVGRLRKGGPRLKCRMTMRTTTVHPRMNAAAGRKLPTTRATKLAG